jgi:hypothetical protein
VTDGDGDAPVLDMLPAMTLLSIENSGLELREFMLARLAALVASDAPTMSYLLNAGAAAEAGITLDDEEDEVARRGPVVKGAAAGRHARLRILGRPPVTCRRSRSCPVLEPRCR